MFGDEIENKILITQRIQNKKIYSNERNENQN
jgi:hypothetical protein